MDSQLDTPLYDYGTPRETSNIIQFNEAIVLPRMATDVAMTMMSCALCARNILKLRKTINPRQFFTSREPLVCVGVEILSPFNKSKSGMTFVLIITDRSSKFSQAVPLRRIDTYTVAQAFPEKRVFKYGEPESVLPDNGSQVSSESFRTSVSW